MTEPVTLYITRHGKTMFNTIHRTQGWSDTPLTKEGVTYAHYFGEGIKDVPFIAAYSSDSGRAIETARIALSHHHQQGQIPYRTDSRIREWCFGSLEGGYDGELWGVIPRILMYENYEDMMASETKYEQLANAIMEADTADWAEPYSKIKERIWNGFSDIAKAAERAGGGNVFVVSHGMTISNFLALIDDQLPIQQGLDNVSVSKVRYADGQFTIESIGDTSFIEKGRVALSTVE